MTKYTEIIYPQDENNTYPKQFCDYIYNRFFKDGGDSLKILDIGCNKGTNLKHFAEKGLECYGVDLRVEGVDFDFRECNLENEDIPYPDNSFDFVYSKSVLEHVFNTENFLKNALRVLKPGGLFVALTPDWKSQHEYFWDDYTHVKPFTRKSLRDAMLINDFEDADCEFFYQLPFVWNKPWLEIVPKVVSLLPDFLKWKDRDQRNTKDRKLIRFSKEKMLLAYGRKKCQD